MIEAMNALGVVLVLAIFGLALGSFAGAMVWRLRARQLAEDKKIGEKVSTQEFKKLKPLMKTSFSSDRSQCLHCHHQLTWYDLLPLLSWLSTGGKCRYCKAKIGWFEPLMELGLGSLFVLSYLLWPVPFDSPLVVFQFGLWLCACVCLTILFAYDLRWFLLPNNVMFPLIALAATYALAEVLTTPTPVTVISLSVAGMILSGLYLALWIVSKGRWVGFGDVKLGLGLALFLIDWRLAFVALFVANILGCLLVLPGLISGNLTRSTRVPFGPLMIVGGVVAMLVGEHIVNWYMTLLIG